MEHMDSQAVDAITGGAGVFLGVLATAIVAFIGVNQGRQAAEKGAEGAVNAAKIAAGLR
jgi:hypothetical protein